jgi:hypothetical protein
MTKTPLYIVVHGGIETEKKKKNNREREIERDSENKRW